MRDLPGRDDDFTMVKFLRGSTSSPTKFPHKKKAVNSTTNYWLLPISQIIYKNKIMMMLRRSLINSRVTTTTTFRPVTAAASFHTSHSLLNQNLLDTPLEWKMSLVSNANENNQIMDTAFFRHPTYEQILQVKQARYSVQLKIQKRTVEILKEKEQVLKNVHDPFERKQLEDQYNEKMAEMKRTAQPDKTLSAEEIALTRELYAQDPYTNTTQSLAQRFGVKPLFILQVVDNLILESKVVDKKKKVELKELKKRNQNKPKKSTRKIHQQK